jgi:nucleotide-binding universal stress UspA family protein
MSSSDPTMVVGYNRSEASRHALTVATDLAARLGARLHVVHVVDMNDYPVDPDSADWEQRGQADLEDESRAAAAALHAWPGEWTYDVRRDDPVRAPADIAHRENALMLVVSTRGGGIGVALGRLLSATPSVSHGLERGGVPVLVVPAPPATSTGRRHRD